MILRTVVWAGWPDQEPGWPAFLEDGAVLRVTDVEANVWLPRALRAALFHWCYCSGNLPPPHPQPHKSRGAGNGRTRRHWNLRPGGLATASRSLPAAIAQHPVDRAPDPWWRTQKG